MGRARNQASHSQRLQQEAADQLQHASLQTSLAHRERLQQTEGLQAHCNAIRQTGTKLLVFRLSGCQPRMVDLMSLDPNSNFNISRFPRRGLSNMLTSVGGTRTKSGLSAAADLTGAMGLFG